jgi:putative nucleotidyltransferase with HDIG domain
MASIRDSIIERLNSLTSLPSINETVRLVLEQLGRGGNFSSGAAVIGGIIEKDLGLSAKVLKIVNSVFYSGRYGRIGDVKQAVARLGIDEVSRICTTVSTMQMFKGASGLINMKEFWKHSVGVAIVMRHFADQVQRGNSKPQNAYVAGLFHDIGILVLDNYFTEIYKKVREAGKEKSIALHVLERELLGIDHGEIGSMLINRWRLPEEIGMSVAWHHAPDSCPEQYRRLSQLIHVANFTCSALGIQEPGDAAIQTSSDGAWHDLNLDTSDLNKIAADVEEGIAQSGVFVSLSI